MKLGRWIVIAAMLPVLSGCLGGFGAPAPADTFGLSAVAGTIGQSAHKRVKRQLLIAEPSALKAFDSEQIVIRPSPSSIEYLANSQWSDRLPNIVQDKLFQAFENSGQLGGVGRPGDGLAIDYRLLTDIRAFDIQVKGGERAVVELSAKVLNDRNGVVVGTKIFRASLPVRGSGNVAYVHALDQAFESVVEDVVNWTLSRI